MAWHQPNTPQKALDEARFIYGVVAELATKERVTRHTVAKASIQLQCHPRTVYRKLSIFYNEPTVHAFLPKKYQLRRQRPNKRLSPEVEEVIQEVIRRRFLGRKEALSLPKLLKLINRVCRIGHFNKVSLSTVRRRVNELPLQSLATAKKVRKPADAFAFKPGKILSDTPLEFVQIDHTLVDQFLDLEEYGLGIRRPWLTLIIDIATRGIYGYYVGFANPTGMSNAIAMMIGCSDKRTVLERCGLSLQPFFDKGIANPWFLTGRPEVVGCDNAADFLKGLFPSGCDFLGIEIKARPVGKPHFGGHIERLIGTFMKDVHMLPGTTFSDVRMRKGYDSEMHSCMSLDDFEKWLLLNILRYHIEPHSALGCTPYQRYLEIKQNTPGNLLQIGPSDIRRAFLKRQPGTIQTSGIRFQNRRYQSSKLAPYVGCKIVIGYQPNDLSRIFVSLDYQFDHLEVPIAPHEQQCWHLEAWTAMKKKRREKYKDPRLIDLAEDLLTAQFELADSAKKRCSSIRRLRHKSRGNGSPDLLGNFDLIPVAPSRNRYGF